MKFGDVLCILVLVFFILPMVSAGCITVEGQKALYRGVLRGFVEDTDLETKVEQLSDQFLLERDWRGELRQRTIFPERLQQELDTYKLRLGNSESTMFVARKEIREGAIAAFEGKGNFPEEKGDIIRLNQRMTALQDAALLNAVEIAQKKLALDGLSSDSDFSVHISGSQARTETGIDSDFEAVLVYGRQSQGFFDTFKGYIGRGNDQVYFERMGVEIKTALVNSGFDVEENSIHNGDDFLTKYGVLPINVFTKDEFISSIQTQELFQISEALDSRSITPINSFDLKLRAAIKAEVKKRANEAGKGFLTAHVKSLSDANDKALQSDIYINEILRQAKTLAENDKLAQDRINQITDLVEMKRAQDILNIRIKLRDEQVRKQPFNPGDIKRGPLTIRHIQDLINSGKAANSIFESNTGNTLVKLVELGYFTEDQAISLQESLDFFSAVRTQVEIIGKDSEGEKFFLSAYNLAAVADGLKGSLYTIDGQTKVIQTMDNFAEAFNNHINIVKGIYVEKFNQVDVNGINIVNPLVRQNVREAMAEIKGDMC